MTTHQKTSRSQIRWTSLPIPFAFAFAMLCLAGTGCGTGAVRSAGSDRPLPIQASGTSSAGDQKIVDIVYILGHDLHRFIATSRIDGASAQALEDHQVLEDNKVDPKRYAEFYEKALAFVKAPRRTVASASQKAENCRNTFTVVVKDGEQSWTESGCRSTDDGAFSRLVRDGQFLLYSKK